MTLDRGHRVMAAFALHAVLSGSMFARLPEIQQKLALSEATFGLVLLGMPIGVVLGSLLVSPLVETWGPRRLILIGIPLLGAVSILLALATSAALLGGAIFIFGLSFAIANVAVNVEADRIEAAEDRRILNRCHGWWGMGFLVTSLIATGLIRVGVAPLPHFAGLAVLLALLVPLMIAPLPVSSPRFAAAGPRRRFAIPGKSTLLIGGFALAGVLLEGTTRSWGVIYVRDVFGAREWLATLALPAIIVTQTAGRFLGDALVERWGAVRVARGMAMILLAGTLVIAIAPNTTIVLAGFALIGFGISIVLPQAFSAAARWGDRPAADNMAAFATLSTLMGFLGPPLFGVIAEQLGLRATFALFIPLPLLAIAFAGYLGARTPADAELLRRRRSTVE